jgi:hypothetical protein
MVAKFGERLSVSKRAAQKFDVGIFNLKKLNDVEVKEQYKVKISNRYVAFENLDDIHAIQNFNFTCCFYGRETLFVTLMEEHRLRLFENRVLRRIFGSKREEVEGGWKRLHNEELPNLYASPYIIRVIKQRRTRLAGM